MNLSGLEKKLLVHIDSGYPILWKQRDESEIIALGERQLPTIESVMKHFEKYGEDKVKLGIESLVNYQFIKRVYLLSKNDFIEMRLTPGKITRTPLAKQGEATIGFQITREGRETIETFWSSKAKQLLNKWAAKISEDYLPIIFAFVIGYLVNAIFGIDLRCLLGK